MSWLINNFIINKELKLEALTPLSNRTESECVIIQLF